VGGSLKEELLKLGLARPKAAEPKPRKREARGGAAQMSNSGTGQGQTSNSGTGQNARAKDREREMRLARLRERIEAHKLDDPQADIKHYYSTGKKIKRIYVTEAQAAALLRGEIVIVIAQGKGRLVPSTLLPALREIDPDLRVVDPAAAGAPEDGVPDDLRW
jgi:uncharacterized protein YaiL (DUF2058 family)